MSEFYGLSHVVTVWREMSPSDRRHVRATVSDLGVILDRADDYMREIETLETVNEGRAS